MTRINNPAEPTGRPPTHQVSTLETALINPPPLPLSLLTATQGDSSPVTPSLCHTAPALFDPAPALPDPAQALPDPVQALPIPAFPHPSTVSLDRGG
ncbi:hypothetical protein PBY51_000009 [Eleginops maclovinus]|uniref:Uncharacterized protein n=1 Tax=Eleginops maclovinus TaxID=56733 RepID=A0AAN7XLE8_ELEMC|nr:hypothetical protein PBY51_000009 [Eleginops maclovinus]